MSVFSRSLVASPGREASLACFLPPRASSLVPRAYFSHSASQPSTVSCH
jgi:hypothetical protein